MSALATINPEQIRELLDTGGPVVKVLIGFSVVALTIFIAKLIQFWTNGLFQLDNITQPLALWRRGERGEALVQVQALGKKPLPDMVATAMHGQLSDDVPEHESREAAARIAADHLDRLKPGMRTLEFIAATSPLLGLLGTVLGMITAFQALQDAGSQVDPSILSGGIWGALLTTAAGLIVAIPAVLMLNILERRMERLHHSMQSATTQVFTVNADRAREQQALAAISNTAATTETVAAPAAKQATSGTAA